LQYCSVLISIFIRVIGNISNLGHDTSRATFFSKDKGAFPENKGFSLFIAKSWVHVPQVLLVSTAMTFMFIIFRSLVSERSKR